MGAGISTAAFLANEVARLSMRSRKFIRLVLMFNSPLQVESVKCRYRSTPTHFLVQIGKL